MSTVSWCDWQVDISKIVAVHLATAHPLVDLDGTTYNMGTHFGKVTSYKIIKFPPTEAGDSLYASLFNVGVYIYIYLDVTFSHRMKNVKIYIYIILS